MTGEYAPEDHEALEPTEIERKFIVDNVDLALLSEAIQTPIVQGYIRVRGDTETRIRTKGDRHYFTVKSGSGMQRTERETTIDNEVHTAIAPLTAGRQVKKTRHEVSGQEPVLEVDIYGADLEGLVVVETEFESIDKANSFMPPGWFGVEVTEDKHYKNQQLALHGLPGLEHERSEIVLPYEVPLDEGLQALNVYAEILQKTLDRPIIIAVAGGSASGKTSAVASKVAEHFGDQALTITLDDYYKGISYMEEYAAKHGRELSFDEPEVVNLPLAAQHLKNLRDGHAIDKPVYDFPSGEAHTSEEMQLGDKSVIVVEGLFALGDDIAGVADVTCFVNTETHGRIIRRFMRDRERTSWSPQEIIAYLPTLEEMHQAHVEPTKSNADIAINNNYNPSIEAERSGLHETQLKYPAESLRGEDLQGLGAELISPSVTQVDTFCNPADVILSETDELLRLRDTNGSITLGYKGPRLADTGVRQRPKFEVPIDEDTAVKLLSALYTGPTITIYKNRTTYLLDGVLITLDEDVISQDETGVEHNLGTFIELRADDKAQIEAVGQKLQLDPAAADIRAYFDM